jgi:hypothetical protein
MAPPLTGDGPGAAALVEYASGTLPNPSLPTKSNDPTADFAVDADRTAASYDVASKFEASSHRTITPAKASAPD